MRPELKIRRAFRVADRSSLGLKARSQHDKASARVNIKRVLSPMITWPGGTMMATEQPIPSAALLPKP